MEPDTQIRTKYCRNCKNRINILHFDVHSAQCVPPPKPPRTKQPKKERKKKNTQEGSKTEESKSEATQDNQELFPCYLCGANQTLLQLDTHHLKCPNRQVKCTFCSSPFPTCIIAEHRSICPNKPRTQSISSRQQLIAQQPQVPVVQSVSISQRISRLVHMGASNSQTALIPRPPPSLAPSANNTQAASRPNSINSLNQPSLFNRNVPPPTSVIPSTNSSTNVLPANNSRNRPNPFLMQQPGRQQSLINTQTQAQQTLNNRREDMFYQNIFRLRPYGYPSSRQTENQDSNVFFRNSSQSSDSDSSQSTSQQSRPQPNIFRDFVDRHTQRSNTSHQRSQQNSTQNRQNERPQPISTNPRTQSTNVSSNIDRSRREATRLRLQLIHNSMVRHPLFISSISELANLHSQGNSAGLTKQQISRLADKKYSKKKEQELQNCSICYCQVLQNQMIKDLECKHLYHSQCISKWLAINTACPLCKFDISKLVRKTSHEIVPQYSRVMLSLRSFRQLVREAENESQQGHQRNARNQ